MHLSVPATVQATVAAGTPVLYGPYVVDFTDIPHDGDTLVLWTPQGGDVLLGFGVDRGGTGVLRADTAGGPLNNGGLALKTASQPTLVPVQADFTSSFAIWANYLPAVITSTDPILMTYVANGDGDLTAGHAEFYALVARAVAP